MYDTRPTRVNPGYILILIDQSSSMLEKLPDKRMKADLVSDFVNRFLTDVVATCTKANDDGEMQIWDYTAFSIIGYGKQGISIESVFEPPLNIKDWVMVSDIANLATEDTITAIKPAGGGVRPMIAAFKYASNLVDKWVKIYPDAFPPMVINITDGYPTEDNGNPLSEKDIKYILIPLVKEIQKKATSDGNVLICNIHITNNNNSDSIEIDKHQPIVFPHEDKSFNDRNAKILYEMSSVLPDTAVYRLKHYNIPVSAESVALLYNIQIDELEDFIVHIFNWGALP